MNNEDIYNHEGTEYTEMESSNSVFFRFFSVFRGCKYLPQRLSNPPVHTPPMKNLTLNVKGVLTADRMPTQSAPDNWRLKTVAGRLVELSNTNNTAALTLATTLILEAQTNNEPVAWISARNSIFFPPDLAASGIDLDALPVVWNEDIHKAARVTDTLLRSGGFGLIVFDIGAAARLPMAMQTRLAGLAKKHHAGLICLTHRHGRMKNLGSVVSLRGESTKQRLDFNRFQCDLRIVKDKRRSNTWQHTEITHGPHGVS